MSLIVQYYVRVLTLNRVISFTRYFVFCGLTASLDAGNARALASWRDGVKRHVAMYAM
jgi:hypothetical protein